MTEVEQERGGERRLIARYRPTGKALKCVAWSPDGTRLAVGSSDSTVRILTPDGTELDCLSGHSGLVWCVAFSPDGRRLASGAADKTIRLWDSDTSTELVRLNGHNESVFSVAFSPDGRYLASGSYDATIRLWDTNSGDETAVLRNSDNSPIQQMDVSLDFRRIASGSRESAISLWDIETATEIIRLTDQKSMIWSVTFSSDGSRLASGASDNTVRLWDAETGVEITLLAGHKAAVVSVAFSPDGRHLVSGAKDSTVRLWEVGTGLEFECLRNHEGDVWSVAFSPDGRQLASASEDGSLCLWDTSDLVQAVAPNLTANDPLALWLTRQAASLGRATAFEPLPAPDVWVPHLEGDDGQYLLGVIRVEDPDDTSFPGMSDVGIALSGDGRRLYSSPFRGRVQAQDLTSGALLWKTPEQFGDLALALSPNGCRLASGAYDNSIRLWDADTGGECACLTGHNHWIRSIAFSPDGQYLASGANDKIVLLWDADTGAELRRFVGHADTVESVAFSPDGRRLASASGDGTILLWDIDTGAMVDCLAGHYDIVYGFAFSPDGMCLASASKDENICLWDAEFGTVIKRLVGHGDWVRCVAFSPDGQCLASGADDKTIRFWDIATGRELKRYTVPGVCMHLIWAPNGAFLVASLLNNTIRIFDTRTPEMLSAAMAPPTMLPNANSQHKTPLPIAWSRLPETWSTLHRLDIAAPLSLLHELRELLVGNSPEAMQPLLSHPGLHKLHGLHWPERARTGLLALLLHNWPGSAEWQPPPNVNSEELRRALAEVLAGHSCTLAPLAPPVACTQDSALGTQHLSFTPPLAWLSQALERVDERLLTLLTALGPQAVAADPGLPLRLLPQILQLPHLTQPQRQLLGLRLAALEAGPAQGGGAGQDRSGIAIHGAITALVPSQWAYPRRLLRWRHLNGGLLYRTRTGREPPQLRPMVILLDTSPACWGLVEALTRPAAHALAEALARQNRAAVLLTAGDNQIHYLNQPAERLQLLTHRSHQPVDITTALTKAQALRSQLTDGPIEPVVVLLTHCWWGAELERPAPQPGLRALFVQYPGAEIRPPFAAQCERWESVGHNQFGAIAGALGRLIG